MFNNFISLKIKKIVQWCFKFFPVTIVRPTISTWTYVGRKIALTKATIIRVKGMWPYWLRVGGDVFVWDCAQHLTSEFRNPLKKEVQRRPILLVWVQPMRPKARGLAQHGGLAGWLKESDPAGVILYVMDGPYRLPFTYRTGCPDKSCPAASWWNFQLLYCYKVNVHNHPPWAASRKEGMA